MPDDEGNVRVTDDLQAGARDHQLCRQFMLYVLGDNGARHVSAGKRVVIGTHESADLVIDDPAVSRFHCEIVVEDGRPLLRDLGSRNGTTVDGVSVLSAYLHDHAVLSLGRTKIRFDLGQGHVRIPLSERDAFGLMVGRSPAMRAAFAMLERAARTDTTVLLLGETGTGKDIAAESIHRESERRDGPFMVIDCGAIPANLLESELFGHERGAFTGASASREGVFEAANGGTLFLDEIGELPLDLQPKLLRALEKREVRRVGGNTPVTFDIRLVAATNRNLRTEVNAQRFRADLYYRLAVLEVTLPPLRERVEDLPGLVEVILSGADGIEQDARTLLTSHKFLADLARHSWPGNVRELRNHLERCAALESQQPFPELAENAQQLVDPKVPLREARERWTRGFEQAYLTALLRMTNNNVSAAARVAGVDRVYLHRLLSRARIR